MVRPDQKRILGTEEATATGILGMLGTEKDQIKRLSDLNEEEVATLTLLETMGKQMKIGVIRKFVENFCQFRVSRGRLGRREIANVITWAGIGAEQRGRRRSIRDLFSGIR